MHLIKNIFMLASVLFLCPMMIGSFFRHKLWRSSSLFLNFADKIKVRFVPVLVLLTVSLQKLNILFVFINAV